MNQLFQYVINVFKGLERGSLPDNPEPSAPSDLGDPLTQDEIDFVKILRKETLERFPSAPTCTEEKTGVAVTDDSAANFEVTWTNPVDYVATEVKYRALGDTDWLTPNALGNATGAYNGTLDGFIFDSGFSVGITYEVRVRNTCPNLEISTGVIVSAEAT